MLHATALQDTPEARALADFWNETHSVAATLSGLRVALVVDGPVRAAASPLGQVCVAWPVEPGQFQRIRVTERELLRIAPSLRVHHVVLAHREVSPPVEQFLHQLGFVREVAGQRTGYWFREGEVPSERPGYRPDGALLPSQRDPDKRLVLVEVDHAWYPLSEAALRTYSHTTQMHAGEAWVFVDAEDWKQAETLAFDALVPPASLAAYGDDAARRAKPGARLVQVRVRG